MKIGILGAGLTGIASALRLAEVGDVVVFEKNEMAGGCLASKKYGSYALETLYHHCFSGDTELFSLMDDLDLKEDLIWLKGSTGYYMNGTLPEFFSKGTTRNVRPKFPQNRYGGT